ncbi:hypothetical protein [Kocuria varians]|uniref:hypothetical protein n=1 Tax=Kocuria varians TaxID=1272 RepID=UPI0008387D2E|nr:hypothetical protein [Kocuria varians]
MFAAHTSARHLKRGRAAQKRGNDAAAREAFADALRVARLGEAWAAAGEAASALGDLERDAGNLSAAEHHYRTGEVQYRRAPRAAQTVGGRVRCLEELGDVLLAQGRPWDAYRVFREGADAAGVDPARPAGAGDGLVFVTREDLRWTSHLATAAQAAGRRKIATEHYEAVLAGCERRRDVAGQILCWRGLARLAEEAMAWREAAHALTRASSLYSSLPDPEAHTDEWVACLRELGAVCKTLGRRDEQVRAFKLAVRLEQIAASGNGRAGDALV